MFGLLRHSARRYSSLGNLPKWIHNGTPHGSSSWADPDSSGKPQSATGTNYSGRRPDFLPGDAGLDKGSGLAANSGACRKRLLRPIAKIAAVWVKSLVWNIQTVV